MTKVKICGITNLEDALVSAKFGADALGFNFYEKSPRCLAPEKAREIIEQLPENILKVGVFVNESLEKIAEIAEIAKLDALQLHGEETPEFACELKAKTSLEIIKAFRVSPEFKPEDVLQYDTDAILLDAFNPQEHGGTGETFDWEIAKRVQGIFPKMYLAGGLSPENIVDAVLQVRPFAIDACSCLESQKGKKDKASLINFISNVRFLGGNLDRPQNLLYHLRLYRRRPKLYLLDKSITHLCIFIVGYLCALDYENPEYLEMKKTFDDFDKYLGIYKGSFVHHYYVYAGYFLEQANEDEERAFDLFYAAFEEFLLDRKDLSNE